MPQGDDDPDSPLTLEGAQAVANAVYQSARASGLGPDRAHRLATHAARHMPGQLRARGLRLTITWVSPEVRAAVEQSRRPFDPL